MSERNGRTTETYAWLQHAPGEEGATRQFAACRWKPEGELFWHYAFVACESDPAHKPREVSERHRLKGESERHFSEVLTWTCTFRSAGHLPFPLFKPLLPLPTRRSIAPS